MNGPSGSDKYVYLYIFIFVYMLLLSLLFQGLLLLPQKEEMCAEAVTVYQENMYCPCTDPSAQFVMEQC